MSPEQKPVNTAEDKTPAEIREEITETREELGDTVEALAEKTDVKAQAKAKVDDVKSQAQAKVGEGRAAVEQNPKPAAIAAALVVLLVLWRLLRS